jgi:hypothetical protein
VAVEVVGWLLVQVGVGWGGSLVFGGGGCRVTGEGRPAAGVGGWMEVELPSFSQRTYGPCVHPSSRSSDISNTMTSKRYR